MRIRNYILGTILFPLIAIFPLTTKSTRDEIFFNKSTLKENYLEENTQNYIDPFRDIKGNLIKVSGIISDSKILDSNTVNFNEGVIEEAFKIYKNEKQTRENFKDLESLILEWRYRNINKSWAKEKDSLIKLKGWSENASYFVAGKEKYYPKNPTYKEEVEDFQKNLEFFGSMIGDKKEKKYYNPKREEELISLGLKPTDCTIYVLDVMSRFSGKDFKQKKYSNAKGLSKFLRKKGFESIYIAQNTIYTNQKYSYSNGFKERVFTKDYLEKIKQKKYFCKIDYVVSDSLFESPAFEEFIKNNSGFVFLQEGKHLGFLNKGFFLSAHRTADPLYESVFDSEKFKSILDNDNPKKDYQSAILFVPKGSVEKFIRENLDKFQK